MEEKMEKTECRKPIKVFSKDRQVKKGIVASTYEEFSNCCKEKFLLDSARLNFVLEEDGTEVDSCYWETLAPNTKVMLLQDDDVWEPAAGTSGSSTDTSTTSSRVIQLMEKFKQKKAAKPSLGQKKNKQTVNVIAGWQHYSYRHQKYQIMKSTKKHFDIGPRPLLFERNSTYEEVMEKMKTTFFPNGKSFLGKIEKMQSRLGNAKGDTIEDSPVFTLGTFVDCCTAQKPRIYILTKTQISTFDPDTSSDSDFSLPDLGFEYTGTAFNSAQHTVSNSVATAAAGAPSDQSLLSPIVQGPVPLETSTPMTFATSSAASSGTNDFRDAGTPTVSLRVPDSTCCICYERQKNAFFIPCGHTACMVCGVQLQSSRRSCHQCRGNIQMVKSIFE